MRRHRILPTQGILLVSTDVHGNAEDFAKLEDHFRAETDAYWTILGDVVHAPDPESRRRSPALYDYEDGSLWIVQRILTLQEEFPERVLFVLGNHDHGHVGGPHPGKFYRDEVAALEARLTSSERALLFRLFNQALLAVAAPCGVLLTHAVPDTTLKDLCSLDALSLEVAALSAQEARLLGSVLTAYGQPLEVLTEMLGNVSSSVGHTLNLLIHGHDRDPSGYFSENPHQACPCIFGAPKEAKRFVRLELNQVYPSSAALRDGIELRRLYPGMR